MNPGNYHPFIPSPRDWPEDSEHENGNYMCHCTSCDLYFTGYKRRLTCHVCHDTEMARRATLTPAQRAAEEEEALMVIAEFMKKLDIEEKARQDTTL